MKPDDLSSHALVARLGELLATERRAVVDFVLHLAEVERRRLHLEMGFPSLFAFCTEHLHLTKAAAYRRTTAVRLLARLPQIADYLRDGRLSLTTLCLLRDLLLTDDATAVLERAAGKTEEQVKQLIAALQPQPAPPDLFRKLPAAQLSSGPEPAPDIATSVPPSPPAPPPPASSPPASSPPASSPPASSPPAISPPAISPPAISPSPRRAATCEPISAELHVLRLTVDRSFVDDLARARDLLSHTIPDGSIERVLHRCIQQTIAAAEKRRAGSATPRPRRAPQPPKGRAIPAHVRREVWRRDAGACNFVGTTGRRCGARYQLELHHIVPFARGGSSTAANLTLRCRAHNLYAAEDAA